MPSLIAMLLAVAVSYFLIPKLAPNVLIIVSSIVLAWALYTHSKQFGITEYERATWYYKFNQYSGLFVFGIIVLVGYYFFFAKGQSGAGNASNMPALNMPTVGGGFGTIARTVHSRMSELLRKGRITLD